MRYSITILLGLFCGHCTAQRSYTETLSLRLEQIRKLGFYENKVVIWIDSVEYHDMSFPYWKPTETYSMDDIVRYRHCQYVALRETKGQRPDTSRTSWTLAQGRHPYLFLRDSAKLEDLRRLLSDKHPYIKTYAFGALSSRKEKELFSAIIENLSDTTQILEFTGDYGRMACPADLMIEYEIHRLSDSEKRNLMNLIGQQNPHLNRGLEVLNQN